MKQCYKCNQVLDLSMFHKNKNKSDGLQNYCKACAKARNKIYYEATPERNPQRQLSRSKNRQKAREFVWDYLSTHFCVDCEESDPVVLEFDHVRGVKIDAIAKIVQRGNINLLAEEIAKCEVRCANCHRRVTAKRGNWKVPE